ncbi:MAG: hypothetical protein JST12_09595 [Armatimonadetes bacterium]|nr:hypothetical protein [Armatimonadota bacterium]MBS1701902.1 hypothetical protein [Armatimonadota bacterium]MBS1728260.1 hypothetical protein [Armatimonadota bacterium]
MNISGLQTAAAAQQETKPRPFQALASALKSGDLAGAQKAFADIQAKRQSKQGAKGNDNDADDQNWSALSSALQSGDLAGAQKAFQSMQTQMSQAHQHHHHHKADDSSSTNTNAVNLSGSLSVDLSA